ncbi:hypothetical protein QZH41_005424 [Actinostola sp. cb2023]|nr:hypothetical protein QZH41_005424 [Actinostola sp. cb2023]
MALLRKPYPDTTPKHRSPRKAKSLCPGCKEPKSSHAFGKPHKSCPGPAGNTASKTKPAKDEIATLKEEMNDMKATIQGLATLLQGRKTKEDESAEQLTMKMPSESMKQDLNVNDLRAIRSLETKVDHQIAELGLAGTGKDSDSDTDSNDSTPSDSTQEDSENDNRKGHKQPHKQHETKRQGKKLKSGLARKASDIVSKYVLWPHEYLLNALPSSQELTYTDLTYEQLIAGELDIIVSGPITKHERDGRLRHLADLSKDATVYPWPTVRNYHKTILQQIERGQLRWSDDFDDLHARFVRKIPLVDLVESHVTATLQKSRNRTRYCGAFQSNHCDKEKDHLVDGIVEKHICGPSMRIRNIETQHAAIDCPHKPRGSRKESTTKPN